ncbi:MAG TPA: TIGR03435 family protein [Bryobacteraceae bacterium]|nr:TIGR03435 family protein [Bryobacteraceae bacterium]
MKNGWAAGLALMTAGVAIAQTAAPKPAFDVASVKPAETTPGRDGGGRMGMGGGRMGMGMGFGGRGNIQVAPASVSMRNVSLKNAIRWAYQVTEYQVSGPDWLDSARFNIVAKSAGPAGEDQLQLMMQTLLQDRFKLAYHRLNKEFQVYALVQGKSGTRLEESKTQGDPSVQPQQGSMTVSVQRMPVSQMIDMLTPIMGAPVIDMTGLKGKYDITVNLAKYAAEMQATAGSAPPDPVTLIMAALEGEAGLKLEKEKIPLEVIVVDHAEKIPTEN